jgi:hypothetical protein
MLVGLSRCCTPPTTKNNHSLTASKQPACLCINNALLAQPVPTTVTLHAKSEYT